MGKVGESVCVRSSTLSATMVRLAPGTTGGGSTGAAAAALQVPVAQAAQPMAPATTPAAKCSASRRLIPARAAAMTEGAHMGILRDEEGVWRCYPAGGCGATGLN